MRRTALACVILAALILVGSFSQAALERSALDSGGEEGQEAAASQVNYLDFLGGIRQFLAYSMWVRSDGIHHAYYGELGAEAELIPYYEIIGWLDPHYIDTYYVAGLTIFYAGMEQEAIDFTRQGIANNPDSGDLYASLADLYLRQGENELALEAYRNAQGRQLELVDEMYIVGGIAAASSAMDDLEGAIEALYSLLDHYRLALLREDLDRLDRDDVVTKINGLADEIARLESLLADSAQAGDSE